AIAADRVSAGRALETPVAGTWEEIPKLGGVIRALADEHFGVTLGEGDSAHLATLVLTRAIAPGQDAAAEAVRSGVDPEIEAAVRAEIVQAAADFQVDLV